MKSLKIGIVSQSYYPYFGGVTEHVHHVALELGRLGHSVTVITGGPQGPVPSPCPRIVRAGRTLLVPSNGARATITVGFALGRWIKRLFESERFDIIQCHCPLTPTLPLLAIKHAPCPVVGTFHASARRHLGYDLFQRHLRSYHSRLAGRVAVSDPARDFVRSYFGGDYRVIPNGVDPTRFSVNAAPLRRFDDDAFNILYVGRLDPRKGLPLLLSSFRRIWLSRKGKARLIVVGDGPLRRRLKALLSTDLADAVHLEGRVSASLLPRYYASSDVLCSPATGNESFGIVLLEAMASGVPVVASDIPGYRTVVANGEQGLLVEPRSIHSLTAALELLADDESLRDRMGRSGLERARQFSWSKVVQKLEAYFFELLDGRVRRPAASGAAVAAAPPLGH
jgi:phosphatidylinositol alpha-mannosyltransferase